MSGSSALVSLRLGSYTPFAFASSKPSKSESPSVSGFKGSVSIGGPVGMVSGLETPSSVPSGSPSMSVSATVGLVSPVVRVPSRFRSSSPSRM